MQRKAVALDFTELNFVKANKDKVGFYKREELNAKASNAMYCHSDPGNTQDHRYRVCRIYMPQMKHCHNHPTNKTPGNYWAIEFDNWGSNKSQLMGWSKSTHDVYGNLSISVGTLKDAIAYAEAHGWGYDVMLPTHRWHVQKNYTDNFKYKGEAPERESYD